MPHLSRITLYPIKSLDPASVDAAGIIPGGALAFDREFAVATPQGRIVRAKDDAAFHQIRATYDVAQRTVALRAEGQETPACFHLDHDVLRLEAWLSRFLNRRVRLYRDTEIGLCDDPSFCGPTLVSLRSYEEVASWYDEVSPDSLRHRFRVNLEISGVPAFWEDTLLRNGETAFQIGDVVLRSAEITDRCQIPGRHPLTGKETDGFEDRFLARRMQTIPDDLHEPFENVYYRLTLRTQLDRDQWGKTLRIGDEVSVLDNGTGCRPARTFVSFWERVRHSSSADFADAWLPGPAESIAGLRAREAKDIPVQCVEVAEETHDVKTFFFETQEGNPIDYKAGQFVTLQLEIDGETVFRSFTLSSTPTQPHRLSVTVKKMPHGRVTRWMHEHLSAGDRLTLNGPRGDFCCVNYPAGKMLLLSGGSGITPMISIVRWICDVGLGWDVCFIHCAQTPQDLLFREELESMAASRPNLRLTFICERADDQSWNGPLGRIDANLLGELAPDFMDREIFACGPEGYRESVRRILEGAGYCMALYHEEIFGAAKGVAPAADVEKDCEIVFAAADKKVACSREDLILDVAEESGIIIPNSCRMGICGTCKVLKREGKVEMDNPCALSEAEVEEGYILTCCSRPRGRVVLEM